MAPAVLCGAMRVPGGCIAKGSYRVADYEASLCAGELCKSCLRRVNASGAKACNHTARAVS